MKSEPKYKIGDGFSLAIPEYYSIRDVFRNIGDEDTWIYHIQSLDNDIQYLSEKELEEYEI